MEAELKQDYSYYLEKTLSGLANVLEIQKDYPDVPIVSDEGVSYIGSKKLLWEEHSEVYWDLVEAVIRKYREAGLWETVVRTCCESTKLFWKDKIINSALNTCLCFPAM